MRKRALLSAGLVFVCALPLAGCSGGAAFPNPAKPTTNPVTAEASSNCHTVAGSISACQRLGDLSTLDPCSLIGVAALPPDLAASPAGRDSLDYCDFTINAAADKGATLEIGELTSTEDGHSGYYAAGAQQLGTAGLNLDEGQLSGGECNDAVQFGGDQVELEINVFVLQGNGSQSLCDAANEVGHALGDVLDSKVEMQHFTVPKNSIATLKACGLVNGAAIGTYTLEGQIEYPSGHYCRWNPDPTDYGHIQLGIDLEIGTRLDAQAADVRSQIGGLESYTLKDNVADYARCEVDTNRIPWGSASSGLVEIASVWATEPTGQVDAACTLATQMAGVVWPKLPPLS